MKQLQEIISDVSRSVGLELKIETGGRTLRSHGYDEKAESTEFSFKVGRNVYTGKINATGEQGEKFAALFTRICIAKLERHAPLSIEERFKKLFLGELDDGGIASLRAEYIGATFDYYVLTIITDSAQKLQELINFLRMLSGSDDLVIPVESKSVAYLKKCGIDDEYQSASDFANTLYVSIKEELRINIVINVGGTAHSFDDLTINYNRCTFAYNFGKLMSPNANIYSYKEFIMMKMFSDMPKHTLQSYLDTLLEKNSMEIIADEELMKTAEEMFNNSLNVSKTSDKLYVHRNTLSYRLNKIEKDTGLNLRQFNDAVVFRVITILNKLVEKR